MNIYTVRQNVLIRTIRIRNDAQPNRYTVGSTISFEFNYQTRDGNIRYQVRCTCIITQEDMYRAHEHAIKP